MMKDGGDVSSPKNKLLAIIELGGYPNFANLYQQAGYEVQTVNSVRKALGLLKQSTPRVIVAEFNFQSDFRDRTSSLESLLAVTQRMPQIQVILFYDREHVHQFEKLRGRFRIFEAFPYPIDATRLADALKQIQDQP